MGSIIVWPPTLLIMGLKNSILMQWFNVGGLYLYRCLCRQNTFDNNKHDCCWNISHGTKKKNLVKRASNTLQMIIPKWLWSVISASFVCFHLYSLGVPATSRILTGDCQKLSFSTLSKVPFLILILIRQTPSKHKFCPASLHIKTEQAELVCQVALS